MSLLNLSVGEFIALFGAISGVLITLYLLDRSRRRQVVSTLRFWQPAEDVAISRQKRRIQQPWSLVLQIASMILLLLAIAQLQFGGRPAVRDNVLLLDTSAWMGARTEQRRLIDDARDAALAWLKTIPGADRVMLVRADGLATPATALDTDRALIERAIRESKPSGSALNLPQAIAFAERVQKLHNRIPGEIALITSGRAMATDSIAPLPKNLRVIRVDAPVENCGIRRVGMRRSPDDFAQWQVLVAAKNYGATPRTVQIVAQFGGAPVGTRNITLNGGAEEEWSFSFRTRAAGLLEVRMIGDDMFPDDNRAVLEAPAQPALRVAAFTDEPDTLRPLLAANPHVEAVFKPVSAYDPQAPGDVVVLDGFGPAVRPRAPAIWINPPPERSPVPVRSRAVSERLSRWNNDHAVGAGLHTRDVQIGEAEVFGADRADVVAEVNAGPVIVAREATSSSPKFAVIGFNPARSALKYELATPLLFANILRWMDPDIFRAWEMVARPVGAVEAHIDKKTDPNTVRVESDAGADVPYTIQHDHLRFFSGVPGTVRVHAGDRELVYALTLPEVGDVEWQVPAGVRRGVPRAVTFGAPPADLWPWLALAGALGLAIEWMLFGRGRRYIRAMPRNPARRERAFHQRAS
jgi:hypothetical protein